MAQVQRAIDVDKTNKEGNLLEQANLLSANLEKNVDRAATRKAALANVVNNLAMQSRAKGTNGSEVTVSSEGVIQGNAAFDNKYRGGKKYDLSRDGKTKVTNTVYNKDVTDSYKSMLKDKSDFVEPVAGAIGKATKDGTQGYLVPDKLPDTLKIVAEQAKQNSDEADKRYDKFVKAEADENKEQLKAVVDSYLTDPAKQKEMDDFLAKKPDDPDAAYRAMFEKLKREEEGKKREANEKWAATNKGVVTETKTDKKGSGTGGSTSGREEKTVSLKAGEDELEMIGSTTITETDPMIRDEIQNSIGNLAAMEGILGSVNQISGNTTNPFTGLRQAREKFVENFNTVMNKDRVTVANEKVKLKTGARDASFTHNTGATSNNYFNMDNSNSNQAKLDAKGSGLGDPKVTPMKAPTVDGGDSTLEPMGDGYYTSPTKQYYAVQPQLQSRFNSLEAAGKIKNTSGNWYVINDPENGYRNVLVEKDAAGKFGKIMLEPGRSIKYNVVQSDLGGDYGNYGSNPSNLGG